MKNNDIFFEEEYQIYFKFALENNLHIIEIERENGKRRFQLSSNGVENKRNEIEIKIGDLKLLLQETDYQAIKFAEGLITEQDYNLIKQQRQIWRDEINNLEILLNSVDN